MRGQSIVSSVGLLLLISLAMLALASVAAFAQQPDPAFFGVWKLDIAKTNFGGQAPPKVHQITIGPGGWISATIDAKGELQTVAIATGPDGACKLIGVPPEYSCEQKMTDPRHTVWTLKSKGAVMQVSEAELLADNKTVKSISKMTPVQGAAYTTEEIWNKVQVPPPAKKAVKK